MNRFSIILAILVAAASVAAGFYFAGDPEEAGTTGTAIQTDESASDTASSGQSEGEGAPDSPEAPETSAAGQESQAEPAEAASAGGGAADAPDGATASSGDEGQPQQQARVTTGEEAEASEAAQEQPVKPSFDVVRVEPTGDAVIAGRAEPNSDVSVMDDGEVIGKARSDQRGEWVVITEEPLEPGTHRLGLESNSPEGEKQISDNEVVIVVPEAPRVASAGEQDKDAGQDAGQDAGEAASGGAGDAAKDEQPEDQNEVLAVVVPRDSDDASRVLQAPGGTGVSDKDLVLQTVDYDENGRVVLAGKGEPGARIVVFLDNEVFGESEVGPEGRWIVRPDERVPPGLHRLRVEQRAADGTLLAQVEIPFARAQLAREPGGDRMVVVQPGNSLWVIARSAYGQGLRYTAIYRANIDQIEDPDLIYPGQIFLVPSQ
ncbi:MAG: LysM peptidoglycan-binding domain-containing protein [Rhodovibrionaceae bacterium]|nr:LysM peptidoglycan-binding domain-containing protein [Rhodovibrionaceae bacterium]